MNIKLEIKEDAELRNFVKDYIRGLVKSIAREEIREVIKEVFASQFSGTPSVTAERIVAEECQRQVRDTLKIGNYENEIKRMAKQMIGEEVKKVFASGNMMT